MSPSEVTAKASALNSELKEERTSLKKLKADYQQMQDDLAETKAEKEAGERVRGKRDCICQSVVYCGCCHV